MSRPACLVRQVWQHIPGLTEAHFVAMEERIKADYCAAWVLEGDAVARDRLHDSMTSELDMVALIRRMNRVEKG